MNGYDAMFKIKKQCCKKVFRDRDEKGAGLAVSKRQLN